jgi:cytochrome P450
MSKSLVIPAGTKLLMAWHTVGLDATAFPEPKKVRAIITSLAAS